MMTDSENWLNEQQEPLLRRRSAAGVRGDSFTGESVRGDLKSGSCHAELELNNGENSFSGFQPRSLASNRWLKLDTHLHRLGIARHDPAFGEYGVWAVVWRL